MQAIVDFLSSIGSAILAGIDFVVSFFEDLVYIIQLTGRFLAQLPSFFSWLPAPVVSGLLTTFAIVVVYKIAGRD